MFQFPWFASCTYGFSTRYLGYPRWVPPFRDLRIKVCLPTPRSLSQATTSFIASDCQGTCSLVYRCVPSEQNEGIGPFSTPNYSINYRIRPSSLIEGMPYKLVSHSTKPFWWRCQERWRKEGTRNVGPVGHVEEGTRDGTKEE